LDPYQNRVNRCRPGYGASCALCCGSHNYALSPEEIEEVFTARGHEPLQANLRHPEDGASEKLFQDAMQCPHVGIDPSDPGIACCLIYSMHDRGAKTGSFFDGTCKTFYCPAWNDLTDRQVLFAAGLMGDWYYYSLLINHIESVHEICARYGSPDDVPDEELQALKEELEEIFLEEDGK
jgi:hypothetical protein